MSKNATKNIRKSPESLDELNDSPSGTQSLLRGLALLEALSLFPNGCPLAKLVEISGFNKSTTHRLLQGLQSAGYATNAPTAGSYRLTTKCVEIGQRALSSLNILHLAAQHLENLNIATGETINFSFREEDHVILIYKLESTQSAIRTRAYIGQHLPLYSSAMGKLFLAFDHKSRFAEYWSRNKPLIVPKTQFTLINKTAMQKELADIRQKMVALDREEDGLGVWCVAAPVFNLQNQVVYAVSISVSTAGLNEEKINALIAAVQKTAALISQEIGGGKSGY